MRVTIWRPTMVVRSRATSRLLRIDSTPTEESQHSGVGSGSIPNVGDHGCDILASAHSSVPFNKPMVAERAKTPWRFTAAFVVLGLITLATIDAVRSSNWFDRPERDDSFFTGYGHCRLSRLDFSPDGQFIATAGTDYTVRVGTHIPALSFAFCVVTQTTVYCRSPSARMAPGGIGR